MDETKWAFKWFWAWNDEREERWLTEMAQQGWHLQSPGTFGFYNFERGAPRNVAYRLDFKTAGKDMEEYLQLFADAGWEYVGAMGSWQYFRKEAAAGETPEIYTDQASKIYKYQRLLLFLTIFLPIYFVMLINLGHAPYTFTKVLSLFFALFLLFYAYAMVRILRRMLELKD